MLQIADAHGITSLFRVPYQIVGQTPAIKLVVENIYSHIARNTEKPLVLAFAGLSGHGKTELATRAKELLLLPFVEIDCAQQSTVWDMLGTSGSYRNSEKGTALNNHLSDNSDEQCVVFLDEFDKTDHDVRLALLKVMDTGESSTPPKLKISCSGIACCH